MNKNRLKIRCISAVPFLLLVFLFFFSSTVLLNSSINNDSWGISKDIIINKAIAPGNIYSIFTPDDKPEYKNKIMNYIIALDKNLRNEIKILREL